MPKHEQKICPRCNNNFECKAGDIYHCQCKNIVLSTKEMAFIEEGYDDCLCINCLLELKNNQIGKKEISPSK